MSSEKVTAKAASTPTANQLVQQPRDLVSRLDQAVVQRIQLGASALSAGDLLALQRSIGNHAVAGLIESQRGGAAAPSTLPLIQAKLQVGPANDAYELEADRIADNVLRAQRTQDEPAIDVAATSTIRRVQRQTPMGAAGGEVSSDVARRLQTSRSTGSSLPGSVRQSLEPKLGADLGGVKVHTDRASRHNSTAN